MTRILVIAVVAVGTVALTQDVKKETVPPSAAAVPVSELFNSSLQNRTWSNTFLQLSWTLPKGLFARTDQEKELQLKASQSPQAVKAYLQQLEQQDAEDQKHGILLRGDDHDPQQLGLTHSPVTDPSGRFRTPASLMPDPAQRTFMILARPLPNTNEPVTELISSEAAKLHCQDPNLKIELASNPVTIAGLSFVHADWMRRDRSNDQNQYFRSYLTTRNGCELIFTFRAESRKALDNLGKSLEGITTQEHP